MTECRNCRQQIRMGVVGWHHVQPMEADCPRPQPLFGCRVQRQVLEFHCAGGHVINSEPTLISETTEDFRVRLMQEEFLELITAMADGDLEAIAKELADTLYVVYGTAVSYGIDMESISAEVHRSNMTKFGNPGEYAATCDETGKSIKDAGGKTLKPSTYEPPVLGPILDAQRGTTT